MEADGCRRWERDALQHAAKAVSVSFDDDIGRGGGRGGGAAGQKKKAQRVQHHLFLPLSVHAYNSGSVQPPVGNSLLQVQQCNLRLLSERGVVLAKNA